MDGAKSIRCGRVPETHVGPLSQRLVKGKEGASGAKVFLREELCPPEPAPLRKSFQRGREESQAQQDKTARRARAEDGSDRDDPKKRPKISHATHQQNPPLLQGLRPVAQAPLRAVFARHSALGISVRSQPETALREMDWRFADSDGRDEAVSARAIRCKSDGAFVSFHFPG